MTDQDNSKDDRLLQASVALIDRLGWERVTLRAIADEAGLSLLDVYDRIPHRCALACWLMGEVDRATLRSLASVDQTQPPRDRLFEIVMARFDQLQRLRPILAMRRPPSVPALVDFAASLAHLPKSVGWMLEAADLAQPGVTGAIHGKALTFVYLAAYRAWLKDGSADLAATMKALDQALGQAARWFGWTGPREAASPV